MHCLFVNPKNNLPVIVNNESRDYMELSFMGYTPLKFGTKRELQELERDMMEEFCQELEMNNIN